MKKIFFSTILFILCISLILSLFSCRQNSNQNGSPPEETKSKYDGFPTVIIDAGHGGEDGGTVGIDGTLEKDINLLIALELDAILRSEGVKTQLTRSEDVLLYDKNSDYEGQKKKQDAAARIRICEEYEDAIFISIHMNSFPQSKYKGLQVYYSTNSPLSAKLADTVQTLVAKNLQYDNTRKTKPSGENIYILKKLQHPAILIECGFLSNPEDCANFNTPTYRTKICLIIFSSVCNYFQTITDNNTQST